MSKVSIGEDQYEGVDLIPFQQFNLWLYELVLDAVDGSAERSKRPTGILTPPIDSEIFYS
jgi:hypothetical protein